MTQEHIHLRRWPPEHAEAARKAGFYVEAMQTIHAWIETLLRDLLLLSQTPQQPHKDSNAFARAWDISNEVPYGAAANCAFVMRLITQQTHAELKAFNSIRNELIHKLLYEPYEGAYQGVPVEKFTSTFELGIRLGYQLQNQVESILEDSPSQFVKHLSSGD